MNFAEDVLERFPSSRPALVTISADGGRRVWAFGELIARSAGLAGAFADRGVRRGDVVMTLVGSRIEWVLALLACWRMGAVALPCNTQLRRHDLELRAAVANPALCVGEESLLGELPPSVEAMTLAEVAATMDEESPQAPPLDPADLDPADPALIVFTSGTTGEPRAAVHPQSYLPGQHTQATRWMAARPGELVWCTTATGWSKSARNVFVAPWICGAAALLADARFDPDGRLDVCEREGVNVLCQAPTEYRMIAKRAELRPLPDMRRMVSAGEALNPEVIDTFRGAMGIEVADGYGQTETGHITGNLDGDAVRVGSMGRPLPGFETRITEGQLEVRAASCPTFFSRYLDSEPFDGEWWPTGDMVRADDDGYLFYEGRADDLIVELGVPDRPVRGGVGAADTPGGRRGRRGCGPRPRARLGGAGDRGAEIRRGIRRAGEGASGARKDGRGAVQVPAHRRVHRRAAQDRQRKDQARRASGRGPLAVARSPRAAFAGIFAVTLLSLMGVGAVLPVIPHYVRGPLGRGDFWVGVAIGAFALTALAGRPLAGRVADRRGRRPVVAAGAALAAIGGLMYLLPLGLPGLLAARLVLGLGEGAVFTAGATWVVDLAPEGRRGRVIGLYGLAVWSGLSLGPPIGDALLRASSFDAVWIFAASAPAIGTIIALALPDPYTPEPSLERVPLIARESIRPGAALSMATIGYAAMASFLVLDLDHQGIGHGATAFTAFALTVVATRVVAGNLPDRIGPLRCAAGAAIVEAIGLSLIALAHSLPVALAGSLAMGSAFALLYPSLSLVVVNRVPEERRGAALGTFTAFFDAGVGLGAPITGIAATLGGYSAAFWVAAAGAMGTAIAVGSWLRATRTA